MNKKQKQPIITLSDMITSFYFALIEQRMPVKSAFDLTKQYLTLLISSVNDMGMQQKIDQLNSIKNELNEKLK